MLKYTRQKETPVIKVWKPLKDLTKNSDSLEAQVWFVTCISKICDAKHILGMHVHTQQHSYRRSYTSERGRGSVWNWVKETGDVTQRKGEQEKTGERKWDGTHCIEGKSMKQSTGYCNLLLPVYIIYIYLCHLFFVATVEKPSLLYI